MMLETRASGLVGLIYSAAAAAWMNRMAPFIEAAP